VRDLADFADETFDLVIDGRCLHCIIGDDRRQFLSAAHRVLHPGGFLHINTMCGEPRSAGLRQNYDPVARCQIFGDVAIRYCGLAEEIIAEVKSFGFELICWSVAASPTDDSEDLLRIDAVKPGLKERSFLV
jgi:SAM-dependent methyltransferase